MKSIIAAGIAALSLSACSIDIHESDYASNYRYGDLGEVRPAERLITIEELATNRDEGGRLADRILARTREAGCRTMDVDSYRKLYRRDGYDHYGVRVVVACDEGSGIL